MFPVELTIKDQIYHIINNQLNENELKAFFKNNPYDVYAIINEGLENEDPMLTTFLVLYSDEFENNVILYDISRQLHTTITTELFFLEKGYIEIIGVGIVDRYSIKFYKKVEIDESI